MAKVPISRISRLPTWDPKNEEEQPTIILFIPKQLEVSLKMNRLDFTRLVGAPKKGSSKSLGLKFSKLGNFNKV